jgi:ASC-1-like (ASCH) protein
MIKKYNQFLKDKTNEEFVFDKDVKDYPGIYSGDETTTKPVIKPDVKPDTDTRPVPPSLIPDEGNSPLESPAKAEIEFEEEAGDVYTNKLKELADALGVEVVDNSVEYNGKKIIFPSETEKYQIEGIKKGFNTVDEVLKELGSEEVVSNEEELEEELEKFESKSYKHTRLKKFKK